VLSEGLRGAAAAIDELAAVHATGLSQSQLRTAHVFSIANVRQFKQLPERVAARVMAKTAEPAVHAIVERAAAAAVAAGLCGSNVENVELAAARARRWSRCR